MRHAAQSVAEYRQNADLNGERDARRHQADEQQQQHRRSLGEG